MQDGWNRASPVIWRISKAAWVSLHLPILRPCSLSRAAFAWSVARNVANMHRCRSNRYGDLLPHPKRWPGQFAFSIRPSSRRFNSAVALSP